jgi:hypothetical protein
MMESPQHLVNEELDLWLDGRLPAARTSHLETCEECRTAAEEIREVTTQLALLPRVAPSLRFADRIMARVARVPAAAHLSAEDLDLWVAGILPTVREQHLRGCADCQALADAERVLVLKLQALPLLTPSPALADRVMAQVDLPVTSIASAWRLWRTRLAATPEGVGIAAGVAVLLGGSVAASAAWAAGHQELIVGAVTGMRTQGEQWFWQGVTFANGTLQAQSWYASLRSALTPARLVALGGAVVGLYAVGIVTLRRLIALPGNQAARALP